jgi:phage major head subunit gpT-like protein
MPTMREWIGQREVTNPEAFVYAIKNRTFESTVAVKREDIEDDSYGVYGPLFQQLGSLAKTHPDELIFALIKGGFAAKCYDGQYFFDTDHSVAGKSVSNMQAGAGEPWFLLDTTKTVKPFIFQNRRDYNLVKKNNPDDENVFMNNEFIFGIDARVNAGYGLWQLAHGSKAPLNEENYAAARTAMRSLKAENGRSLLVTPSTLVVGPSNEDAARKLLIAQQGSAGASNVYANTAELIVSGWLD